MQIVIDIPDEKSEKLIRQMKLDRNFRECKIIELSKGHGRLGDLDELEQRISNFVEHDAHITDEYTVARQRFIVDGIRQTTAIIEADKES